MKRHILLKLIAAMLCFVTLIVTTPVDTLIAKNLLAQASEKVNVKKGLDLYQQGKYREAKKQFKKYAKKASESSVKNISDKMKKAYLEKVLKYQTFSEAAKSTESREYIWDYYLTDINKDGIAELLIKHGTSEADCLITIYTYKKNKAIKVNNISGGHSVLYAYPDGNGFIRLTGQMGYETITRVTLQESKVTEKKIGSRDIGTGSYMDLPFELESHISSDGLNIDYSALK